MKKKLKHVLIFCIGVLITGIILFVHIKYSFSENLLQKGRKNVSNKFMPEVTDAIAMDGEIIVLCRDGTVWKWDYISGMEGAVRVSGLEGILKLAATGTAVYALSEDGYIYAWGSNSEWSISPEEKRDKIYYEPVPLMGLNNIVDMGAKNGTAFAVDDSGELFVWGLYLYGDEWKDRIPGFPEDRKGEVKGVQKIFAGADGYHYFMKEDGMVFSIMESPGADTLICDFIFPELDGENKKTDHPRFLDEIEYIDLREGTKYAVTVLYELGTGKDIVEMDADGYTVFMYRADHTLWYWDSNTIKYHDFKDAMAEPESGRENYAGNFEQINVREILGTGDGEEIIPEIKDICAGKENAFFLTEDGQVFMSEYVTHEVKDVEYYNVSDTRKDRVMDTSMLPDMHLKKMSFRKLDLEHIVCINTDGGSSFLAVGEDGKCYLYDLNEDLG